MKVGRLNSRLNSKRSSCEKEHRDDQTPCTSSIKTVPITVDDKEKPLSWLYETDKTPILGHALMALSDEEHHGLVGKELSNQLWSYILKGIYKKPISTNRFADEELNKQIEAFRENKNI